MQLELGVLAEYANVTQDGKLNICGVVNAIQAPAFPILLPSLMLVLIVEIKHSELGHPQKLTVKLATEDGNTMFELTGEIQADAIVAKMPAGAPPARLNQILRMGNVVIPEAGTYVVYVLINWQEEKSLPLHVTAIAPLAGGQ